MSDWIPDDPTNSPESDEFYAAARAGRFLIRRCSACRKAHWYPRSICPFCSGETAWEDASGKGEIYSFTVARTGGKPRVLAYIQLREGPIMLSSLVEAKSPEIGDEVQITLVASHNGTPIPCFSSIEDLKTQK